MVELFFGGNSYEIEHELDELAAQFDGVIERIDGSELERRNLPDIFTGQTLFAERRLVVIRGASDNKSIWTELEQWLDKIPDETHVILVETAPDKRTKTFKALQKHGTVREFAAWSERDSGKAQQWVSAEATRIGLKLDANSARTLVNRIGSDQWQLHHALEKLSVLDNITPAVIEQIIEANPTENVFQLFDAALAGNPARVQDMIKTLALSEDAYRVFGLIASQVYQLIAVAVADLPTSQVAKDLKAAPFVISKLEPRARTLSKADLHFLAETCAQADQQLKISADAPWSLLETSLIRIALHFK